MNPWQISRMVKETSPDRPKLALVELDEAELEIFWQYAEQLKKLGVDLHNDWLQESINANPSNLEEAILLTLDYDARPGWQWKSSFHSTNFLGRAIRENWKRQK